MNGIERRYLGLESIELRVEKRDGKVLLQGYPIVYGKMSVNLGGFREIVAQGSLDASLLDDDIRGLRDHNPTMILGRTKAGTMKLSSDERGVHMEIELPDTQVARDLIVSVERGDVSGGSFGFRVAPDGVEWAETDEGIVRTIRSARLFDVGPVTFPAYPDTEMWTRAMNLEEANADLERWKLSRLSLEAWREELRAKERELRMRA